MGILRSIKNHAGIQVNGVTLGQPSRDVDENEEPTGEYRWDDSKFPNGEINSKGKVIVDEVEL